MKKILSIILVLVFVFSAPLVFAKENGESNEENNYEFDEGEGYEKLEVTAPKIPKPATLIGPSDSSKISETRGYVFSFILVLTKGFLSIVAALAVVMLIVSGIMYMIAFGDEEKLGTAKKSATFAIVGLLTALFAYGIVSVISSLPLPSEGIEEATEEELEQAAGNDEWEEGESGDVDNTEDSEDNPHNYNVS